MASALQALTHGIDGEPEETRWSRYWRKARRLESTQQKTAMSALGKAQDMWNPWHATLLVAEIAGMIAAEDSVTSGLIEAQRRLGEIYETKGDGDE